MVKLSGNQAERWLDQPDPVHRAVLLYGPNGGLVRDRARQMVRTFSGGHADDPFRVVTLDEQVRKGNPSAVLDEAFSLSFGGGDKVVWLHEASDKLSGELGSILESVQEANFLVVEAAGLAPRSKLRLLFEGSAKGVAIGCYEDDENSLRRLAAEIFRANGVHADRAAIDTLISRLGTDRLAGRSEIEKVCLFAGENGELDEDGVMQAVGDSGVGSADECVYAIFDGRRDDADRLLARSFEDGVGPVQLVRRLQGHLDRLLSVRAGLDRGEAMDRLIGKLRPPLFFKYKGPFQRQVSVWRMGQLEKCLDALTELEIECKSTGMPDIALCQRVALSISGLARRQAR